jgi:hypothetical protein
MSSAITSEELRAALTAFVNEDPDVFWGKKHPKPSLKQAAKVHARGNHSSVTRYFNKRILPIEGLIPEETKSKRLAEIDNLMLLPRGNPDFLGQTIFTQSDCDTIKATVIYRAGHGFPYEKTTFAAMCQGLARAKLEDEQNRTGVEFIDRLVSDDCGDIPDCGESWYRT